jgi:hypothetical protein
MYGGGLAKQVGLASSALYCALGVAWRKACSTGERHSFECLYTFAGGCTDSHFISAALNFGCDTKRCQIIA